MKQCIYCAKTKNKSEFNAEHVIPQSFGKFKHNLTLHCVCKKCNTQFGKELDEKLACDAIEAIERTRHGIKKTSEFRSLGRRSTLHVRITADGPLKGAYGHHIPGPDGENLPIAYSPQVGFGHSPDGPFEWFLLDEIPSKDEIAAKGYGRDVVVRSEGITIEQAQVALVAAGYSAGSKEGEFSHKDERFSADTVGIVGDADCRAVSKIAFNYFAFVFGAATALMPQFNVVRSYVADGGQPRERIVTLHPSNDVVDRTSDGAQVNGHYIAVRRDGSRIVAQVSLFLRLRYTVVLSADEFLIAFEPSSAHFFDLESREIGTIPLPPPFH